MGDDGQLPRSKSYDSQRFLIMPGCPEMGSGSQPSSRTLKYNMQAFQVESVWKHVELPHHNTHPDILSTVRWDHNSDNLPYDH